MKNETAKREIESLDYYLQNHTDDYSEESHTAMMMAVKALEQEPCDDAISRQAVLKAIDAKAWEFCDYLISKGRNDEQKPVSHFADNLRECVREDLPSVNPQLKTGHWIISPNDCFATCSECGLSGDKGIFKHYRWCPICGTKMSEIPTGSDDELYSDCIDAFKEYALGRK